MGRKETSFHIVRNKLLETSREETNFCVSKPKLLKMGKKETNFFVNQSLNCEKQVEKKKDFMY